MPSQMIKFTTVLALCAAASAQGLDFDQIFGSGNSNCDGTTFQSYCCPGSVLSSGDFGNNNNNDVSGLICCVGDPSHGFNNIGGVTTCSAGTATPLTAVSQVTTGAASATTSAASATATSDDEDTETTSTDASSSEPTTFVIGGVTGSASSTSSAETTRSNGLTTSTAGGAAASASSGNAAAQSTSSSSSSAGAARAIVTGAPILGGAALGMLALL